MLPAPPEEKRLVILANAAKGGSEHAMQRFLAEAHVHVARCCRAWLSGIGNDAVQEVTQEALLRIGTKLPTCQADDDETLLAWCRAVARHAAFDRLRADRREWELRALSEELDEVEYEPAEAEHTPAVRLLLAAVDEALGTEPEAVHALLWHRMVQRDAWDEAAGALGLTPAGAKRRFQRTLARLRSRICSVLARRPEPARSAALRVLARHGVEEELVGARQ